MPIAADWVTISALATFASVRSANRTPRGRPSARSSPALRPVLMPTRLDDPEQKIGFADGKWFRVAGGDGIAEATGEAVYLAIPLRNAGSGIAVLHGWHFYPERIVGRSDHAPIETFRRLTRDLYVPAGDVGFWQGAFRDPAEQAFEEARAAVSARDGLSVEVLYGDHERGQRTISRLQWRRVATEVGSRR